MKVDTLAPIVDVIPVWTALAELTSMKFLPKYTKDFMVAKLRADIRDAKRNLAAAEAKLDAFAPKPKRSRRK